MLLAFMIYLTYVLDGLKAWSFNLAIVSVISTLVFLFIFILHHDVNVNRRDEVWEKSAKGKKAWAMRFGILALVFSFISTSLPTQKTSYMMAAGYATQRISESQVVSEVSSKLLTILNQKLDNIIEEETAKVSKEQTKESKK